MTTSYRAKWRPQTFGPALWANSTSRARLPTPFSPAAWRCLHLFGRARRGQDDHSAHPRQTLTA